MSETLDLSGYKTAHGAAQALEKKLKSLSKEDETLTTHEISLDKIDDRDGERWAVSWPSGPTDWAVRMAGGTPVFSEKREVTGFYASPHFSIECDNSYTISFYNT